MCHLYICAPADPPAFTIYEMSSVMVASLKCMGYCSCERFLYWHIIGATNVEHNLREASASFGWNRLFHPIWTLKTTVQKALLNGCKEEPTCSLYIKPLQAFHAWCPQGVLEIRCKSIVKTGQTEQPQLHWLSHVILTQGQNNPIWPSMPQKSLYRWLEINAIMKTMLKYPWQMFSLKHIGPNYWETKSSSWWAEECMNIKRRDHI